MNAHTLKVIAFGFCISSLQMSLGQTSSGIADQKEDTKSKSFQALPSQTVTLPSEEKILDWLVQANVPAVGIGVIENGQLSQVKVLGKLDENRQAPQNTVFNVASLTKPVVAMLTLRLVQEGKWNLDEPLFKYWIDPDIRHDSSYKLLTTRLILSHQTGFPNWRADKKLSFEFKPGTRHQYSGEGFEYLKKALETKFNTSLEELAQTYVFTPFVMKDTRFVWDSSIETRFALWHDKKGTPYQTWKRTEASAADDLLTTIEDYGRFGENVLKGAGLSKELFNAMKSPQVSVNTHVDYGLGWLVIKDLPNNEYALVHSGADKGVRTIIILLPHSQRGIILLTNGDNGHKVMQQIGNESLNIGKQLISYLR